MCDEMFMISFRFWLFIVYISLLLMEVRGREVVIFCVVVVFSSVVVRVVMVCFIFSIFSLLLGW